MKSFRQELLESIETFEDAKNVVSEWLIGGVELETTKLKLYENMYLTKKAIDILDLRNSIIEKVNVALQSLSKIAITEADNIMTETYDKSIKSIKESIDKSLTRNERFVWRIIGVLKESGQVFQEGWGTRLGGAMSRGIGRLAGSNAGSVAATGMSGKLAKASGFVGRHAKGFGRAGIGVGVAAGLVGASKLNAARKARGQQETKEENVNESLPGQQIVKSTAAGKIIPKMSKLKKGGLIGGGIALAAGGLYGAKKMMDKKAVVNKSKRKK